MYKMDFELRGKKYRIEVKPEKKCYDLQRMDDWGVGRSIPCFTDAEERRYPKDAAWVATAYLRGIKDTDAGTVKQIKDLKTQLSKIKIYAWDKYGMTAKDMGKA